MDQMRNRQKRFAIGDRSKTCSDERRLFKLLPFPKMLAGLVLIIVGSRRGGLWTGMHEFFGGSVAVHLAQRQHRPLVVIPLGATPHGSMPWEHEQA